MLNSIDRFKKQLWCAALSALLVVCVLQVSSPLAWAQAEEPAAPAVAPAEAAPLGPDAAAGEPPPHTEQSFLWWVIHTSGAIGAVILALSFYFVASVTRSFFDIRASVMMPPALVEECDALINARDYNGLYNRVKDDTSFFGSLMLAGLTELRNGLGEAREAMDRVADAGIADLEKRISMMAVLGTLGPMIGLLGTLKGMIASFSVIAMSDTAIKPSEVAGGISEALLLTFEGVLLSVPAIYFFAVFRNRINSVTAEAALMADSMMRKLHNLSKSKSPAAPQRPATATPEAPAAPTA